MIPLLVDSITILWAINIYVSLTDSTTEKQKLEPATMEKEKR